MKWIMFFIASSLAIGVMGAEYPDSEIFERATNKRIPGKLKIENLRVR